MNQFSITQSIFSQNQRRSVRIRPSVSSLADHLLTLQKHGGEESGPSKTHPLRCNSPEQNADAADGFNERAEARSLDRAGVGDRMSVIRPEARRMVFSQSLIAAAGWSTDDMDRLDLHGFFLFWAYEPVFDHPVHFQPKPAQIGAICARSIENIEKAVAR